MKDQNPFKQKLYNHTMPVSGDLWNRIEAQLPPNKKRFPFFFFTLASIVIISGALILWSAHNDDVNSLPTNTNDQSYPQHSSEQLKDVSENQSSSTAINKSGTDVESSEVAGLSKNVNNSLSSTSFGYSTAPKKSSTLQKKNDKVINGLSISLLNTSKSENVTIVSTANFNTSSRSSSVSSNLSSTVDYIPLSEVDLLYNSRPAEISLIKPDPSCYKFSSEEGKSNLSLDLFGGPGFAPQTFESTSAEANLYADARKLTERNQYGWSAGARINLNLNHEFAVRLGVLYEQIGDIFDYTDTLATQHTTRIDSFFAADGTFLYAQSNTVVVFGTLIKKIHNRYHHLDIPLLLSYELPMGRATLMLNAGPVINLTTNYRGQILDSGLAPRFITEGEVNQIKAYKSNIGLSVYLGAGALIPFNKNISGLIEPRFQYRINPVTHDGYVLKEHRHFAGLNLGIRYHFD